MEKLIKTYLEYRRTLGLSKETLNLDRSALRKFQGYLQSHGLQFDKITIPEVRDYFSYITATLKPVGAYKFLNILKCFYRYLYDRNLILFNPCRNFELPEFKQPLPKNIPTREQIKQLLELPDLTTKYGIRNRAILELVYSSGLRLREVTRLDLADLDLKNQLLRVRGKGNKERIAPFGKPAAFYLKKYLQIRPNIQEPALFLSSLRKRLHHTTLEVMIESYAQNLGIKLTFHSLRHACALHLLQNKAGIRYIQELLGHSDLSTTQIYTRLLPLDLKKAHTQGHPREKEARKNVQ
ncbi:MAG TPA: tyrosine-type recombinase/integrase [Bacillota bacterium]|nr:tyrosine-type recombinase/integrase [Bacillota bacterium]